MSVHVFFPMQFAGMFSLDSKHFRCTRKCKREKRERYLVADNLQNDHKRSTTQQPGTIDNRTNRKGCDYLHKN